MKKVVPIVCVVVLLLSSFTLSVGATTASPKMNWGSQLPNYFKAYAMTLQDSDYVKFLMFSHNVQSTDDRLVVIQSPYYPFTLYTAPYVDGWKIFGNIPDEYGVNDTIVTVTVFDAYTGNLISSTETLIGSLDQLYTIPYVDNEYYTMIATFGSVCDVYGKWTQYFPYQGYDYTKWLNALYMYSVTSNAYLSTVVELLEQIAGIEPDPEQTTRSTDKEDEILSKEDEWNLNQDEYDDIMSINPFEDLDVNGVTWIREVFERILNPFMPVLTVLLLGGIFVFILGRKVA